RPHLPSLHDALPICCLGAVADHIDCWVIGDTGSTDGTQDFIRSFFAARKLPGELHEFPFKNFEQARNTALDHAYASPLAFDYLLDRKSTRLNSSHQI